MCCGVSFPRRCTVNRGLSRALSGAGTRDEPHLFANDCIIRGVDSSLFTYFKQFKLAMTVNVLELKERNRQ